MQAAKDNFDIPLILSPENLASPDLDELSGMTYLSYFMKVDSPGYFATLEWTKEMIPHKNVNNFQVKAKTVICVQNSLLVNFCELGWPFKIIQATQDQSRKSATNDYWLSRLFICGTAGILSSLSFV